MNSEDKKFDSDSSNNNLIGNKKTKSFFEIIMKYNNKININYDDFDFQKGENSPRLLFKKRKHDNNIDYLNYGKDLNTTSSININNISTSQNSLNNN